jgi:uncharacterized protein
MSRDYAASPATDIRRADRAMPDEDAIKALLHHAPMGTLATVYEGQPFINSNLFVYDEARHCIYMHTAKVGRTRANVDTAERVCFSVSEMGRLLPAPEALEFSVEYGGVVIFGRASVVTDAQEATDSLQQLLDKYFPHLSPGQDYHPIKLEELVRTAVYRIEIEQWSGKRKQVAEDFPGAFWYGQPPANGATT